MIRNTFSKSLFVTCLVAGATVAHAQDAMPQSSPPASGMATQPGQSPDQTPAQQLTDSQITSILIAANQAEVSQGKHAQKTAKSKDVVQFAKQMVTEHGSALKDVKSVNARLKVKEQSSAIRDQLEAAAKASDARLKGKKGADFEKTYIEEQVTMHQTVLDTIDTQLAPNAKAEELKTLLTKTRTAVASHLDHAKQLQSAKASM